MDLRNLSPFSARAVVVPDRFGQEELLVLVKATYDVRSQTPTLHEEQEPVWLVDEYHGEPGRSSLRHGTDVAAEKPLTDVIFVGSAYAPSGGREYVDARLRVGPLDKRLRVFGDRFWRRTAGFLSATAPVPFQRMPVVWDRAFGGWDETGSEGPEWEPSNPVGVGFRGEESRMTLDGTPLPNVESPDDLITGPGDRSAPWGLSFVSPNWASRAQYAGTYDDAWQNDRAPLLPDDFDSRFHQAAPPDQLWSGEIPPGTSVELDNLSPSGRLAFLLPRPGIEVAVRTSEARNELEVRRDTVILDGDGERLIWVARARFPVADRVYDVQWIRVAGTERDDV
jgi:hypothetical protein